MSKKKFNVSPKIREEPRILDNFSFSDRLKGKKFRVGNFSDSFQRELIPGNFISLSNRFPPRLAICTTDGVSVFSILEFRERLESGKVDDFFIGEKSTKFFKSDSPNYVQYFSSSKGPEYIFVSNLNTSNICKINSDDENRVRVIWSARTDSYVRKFQFQEKTNEIMINYKNTKMLIFKLQTEENKVVQVHSESGIESSCFISEGIEEMRFVTSSGGSIITVHNVRGGGKGSIRIENVSGIRNLHFVRDGLAIFDCFYRKTGSSKDFRGMVGCLHGKTNVYDEKDSFGVDLIDCCLNDGEGERTFCSHYLSNWGISVIAASNSSRSEMFGFLMTPTIGVNEQFVNLEENRVYSLSNGDIGGFGNEPRLRGMVVDYSYGGKIKNVFNEGLEYSGSPLFIFLSDNGVIDCSSFVKKTGQLNGFDITDFKEFVDIEKGIKENITGTYSVEEVLRRKFKRGPVPIEINEDILNEFVNELGFSKEKTSVFLDITKNEREKTLELLLLSIVAGDEVLKMKHKDLEGIKEEIQDRFCKKCLKSNEDVPYVSVNIFDPIIKFEISSRIESDFPVVSMINCSNRVVKREILVPKQKSDDRDKIRTIITNSTKWKKEEFWYLQKKNVPFLEREYERFKIIRNCLSYEEIFKNYEGIFKKFDTAFFSTEGISKSEKFEHITNESNNLRNVKIGDGNSKLSMMSTFLEKSKRIFDNPDDNVIGDDVITNINEEFLFKLLFGFKEEDVFKSAKDLFFIYELFEKSGMRKHQFVLLRRLHEIEDIKFHIQLFLCSMRKFLLGKQKEEKKVKEEYDLNRLEQILEKKQIEENMYLKNVFNINLFNILKEEFSFKDAENVNYLFIFEKFNMLSKFVNHKVVSVERLLEKDYQLSGDFYSTLEGEFFKGLYRNCILPDLFRTSKDYNLVCISNDNREIKCHKEILMFESNFFYNILKNRHLNKQFEKKENFDVLKVDLSYIQLKIVIEYLYLGKSTLECLLLNDLKIGIELLKSVGGHFDYNLENYVLRIIRNACQTLLGSNYHKFKEVFTEIGYLFHYNSLDIENRFKSEILRYLRDRMGVDTPYLLAIIEKSYWIKTGKKVEAFGGYCVAKKFVGFRKKKFEKRKIYKAKVVRDKITVKSESGGSSSYSSEEDDYEDDYSESDSDVLHLY